MTGKKMSTCLQFLLAYIVASCAAREAIIGGIIAKDDQFPYHVSLQTKETGHYCGGGVIAAQFILTAGHCFLNNNAHLRHVRVTVFAGSNDLQQHEEPADIIQISKVFVPKEFNPKLYNTSGDIAVAKLKHPFKLSEHIKELQVPKFKDETFAGRTAKFCGFGWDWIEIEGIKETGGFTDSLLRWSKSHVLSNAECQHEYDAHRITENKLCARVEQHDKQIRGACKGDSGGLLVHDNTFIGVLSRSPLGCNEKQKASIYTRVSHYLQFIDDAIHERTHDDIVSFPLY